MGQFYDSCLSFTTQSVSKRNSLEPQLLLVVLLEKHQNFLTKRTRCHNYMYQPLIPATPIPTLHYYHFSKYKFAELTYEQESLFLQTNAILMAPEVCNKSLTRDMIHGIESNPEPPNLQRVIFLVALHKVLDPLPVFWFKCCIIVGIQSRSLKLP